MNYYRVYMALVEKCKVRGLDKSSLSYYTEAHHIIPKSLGGSNAKENLVLFTAKEHFVAHKLLWYSDKSCVNMQRALNLMSNKGTLTSRQFEVLRKEISENSKGEKNPFFGKNHTDESKKKWIESRKGWKPSQEAIEKTRLANLGAKRSKSAKSNMSKAALAKKLRPWQTSTVMVKPSSQDMWLQADFYYGNWISFGSPGERRFKTLYDYFYNDCIPRGSFPNLIKLFKNGWVPMNDPEWVAYKGGENA